MDAPDIGLIVAGLIGSGVAAVHGLLTQRLMVRPVASLDDDQISPIGRILAPPILHFSTFNWFLGGFALIAAALWLGQEARFVVGLLVGSSYLYGALVALWATRGRHPSWALYVVALGLIGFGIADSGN